MSYSKGLEGVVAGETSISNVEGDLGRLTYRGYPIEELVNKDYLDVAWLVWFGEFPDDKEKLSLGKFMGRESDLTSYENKLIETIPSDTHPMKVLQALIPVLSLEPINQLEVKSDNKEFQRGLKIIAKIPQILVAYRNCQLGKKSAATSSDTDDIANAYLHGFLLQFTGAAVAEKHLSVLKLIQILQMEHSFNAGTFASMVAGSTLAPIEAVIATGVSALSGNLHGGADQAALEVAEEVGRPEHAGEFVQNLLKNKGRLMGMGHREYKVVDPRSVLLKPVAEDLCTGGDFLNLYKTLEAIETEFNQAMKVKGKDVWANLEFYKGISMLAIGVPKEYFTAVFAMARSVGWLAHFMELRQDNRIYRPKALYTGKAFRSVGNGS